MAILPVSGTEHRYQTCGDEDCERYICRVYKEGFRNGWDAGWQQGYIAGHVKGFNDGYQRGHREGYAEGVANCPRQHA